MNDYMLAVTIVDAHTTRTTWKLAGKIVDVMTITVSPDGSTISARIHPVLRCRTCLRPSAMILISGLTLEQIYVPLTRKTPRASP